MPIYRACADALRASTAQANARRRGSAAVLERECHGEALWLLQHADVVVACSRSDGWSLVASEAFALGSDSQRLILSSMVGAAELIGPFAQVVDDPYNDDEIARAMRTAIEAPARTVGLSRRELALPTPGSWWSAILEAHRRYGLGRESGLAAPL